MPDDLDSEGADARYAHTVAAVAARAGVGNSTAARRYRYAWVLNHGDIVAFIHALRVELTIKYVMATLIPSTEEEPFLYWFRFEWGANGNPHTHTHTHTAKATELTHPPPSASWTPKKQGKN